MIPRILIAAAGAKTAETAAIDFQTALLLVMVVCLAFMAMALADLSRRVRDLTEGRDRSPVAPAARGSSKGRPASAPAASDGAFSPEHLAVITGAVYTVIDRPVRIVAVDEVTADQSRTWSLEGRRQIFTSHRVR